MGMAKATGKFLSSLFSQKHWNESYDSRLLAVSKSNFQAEEEVNLTLSDQLINQGLILKDSYMPAPKGCCFGGS